MRKPEWLRVHPKFSPNYNSILRDLSEHGLYTVCQGARCPNQGACWDSGTATFMLMGHVCTRHCSFCSVRTGSKGEPLNSKEPASLAKVATKWGLKYAVLTSVDRDDLPDAGAGHFASCIKSVRAAGIPVEALIPDFGADEKRLTMISSARPNVVAHNIEVVARLAPKMRDRRAGYGTSLAVLKKLKEIDPNLYTKSGIMVGVGETQDEVEEAMDDLRSAGTDFLTIGQYLQPTKENAEVAEYVHPSKFEEYERVGIEKGFRYVASGPFVRSSYKAAEFYFKLENEAGSITRR
ncbi:MAG: lipoyl synthase [archaeon]